MGHFKVTEKIFSKRHGLQPFWDEWPYDVVPDSVRDGLLWVVERILSIAHPGFSEIIGNMLAHHIDTKFRQRLSYPVLRRAASTWEWYDFYDVCELCHQFFSNIEDKSYVHLFRSGRYPTGLAVKFTEELNRLFDDDNVGYRLNHGLIERSLPTHIALVIEEVRNLLHGPKFKGPDEQFGKAIAFLNQRPQPDTENCVKEATGALEGVARILSGDTTAGLGKMLNDHFKPKLAPALYKLFEGMWGYASNAPGARHAKVGDANIAVEEAEFTLHTCAAMILYISKLNEGKIARHA